MSFIQIRPHYSALAFTNEIVKPHVRIDGGPEFLLPGWQPYRVAVPPGPHVVEVWMAWGLFQTMGLNPVTVQVPPEGVQLSWRAPNAGWMKGKVQVGPPDDTQLAYVDPSHAAPGGVAPVLVPTAAPPAQWAPDPTGRHQFRWFDGARWTDAVSDGGVVGSDPPG